MKIEEDFKSSAMPMLYDDWNLCVCECVWGKYEQKFFLLK